MNDHDNMMKFYPESFQDFIEYVTSHNEIIRNIIDYYGNMTLLDYVSRFYQDIKAPPLPIERSVRSCL